MGLHRYLLMTKYRRKYFILLTVLLIPPVILILNMNIHIPVFMKAYYWAKPEKGVFCHSLQNKMSLPDISEVEVRKGQSIFFHETSCNSFINGKITLTSRQACAVESAARMNPDLDVYLLFSSPGEYIYESTESDGFLGDLINIPNVRVLHVDMERYFKGTPVENLWTEEKMRYSKFAQSHTSDVLRFLTLWKYGGYYLDLDVIVIKSLKELGTDFSGLESNISVASGILSFNYTGQGHKYVTSCLEDLRTNFRGNEWGWNGPGTVTRLLKKLCGVNAVPELVNRTCKGFKVYHSEKFYVIPWWNWKWFFDSKFLADFREFTSQSYIIHVWNKFSASKRIPIGEKGIPYLEYAKKYCPNIVRQCEEYF